MPNKYYLRSDRTAVQPKKEEPELWHVYKDGRIGVLLPDEMASCMIFEDHLASLPALDVDPDYLKRLSPGWFEGEERREILTKCGWAEIGGDWYNRAKESHRRLTIVAPQEASKHPEWDKTMNSIKELIDENIAPQEAEKGQEGDRYAKLKQKMREFFDSVTPEELIEKFEKMSYTFVPIPATPQPVTGAKTKEEIADDYTGLLAFKAPTQLHEAYLSAMEAYATQQASSRPSDAVELERLRDWKESAMKVMNEIDLQECGKVLGVPLGQSIADKILPALKELKARVKELEDALRNTVKVYSLMNKKTCESMGLDDPETFKAFLHAKSLLRTPPTK